MYRIQNTNTQISLVIWATKQNAQRAFRVDFPSNALASHVLGSHKSATGYQTRPYIVAAKDNTKLISISISITYKGTNMF
jgi:hypothetical protein